MLKPSTLADRNSSDHCLPTCNNTYPYESRRIDGEGTSALWEINWVEHKISSLVSVEHRARRAGGVRDDGLVVLQGSGPLPGSPHAADTLLWPVAHPRPSIGNIQTAIPSFGPG